MYAPVLALADDNMAKVIVVHLLLECCLSCSIRKSFVQRSKSYEKIGSSEQVTSQCAPTKSFHTSCSCNSYSDFEIIVIIIYLFSVSCP